MTGYVARPMERGPGRPPPRVEDGEFDVMAEDFLELAARLVP
jgi:2-haloacid dehalogenase